MDKYKRHYMQQRQSYCKERDDVFLSMDEKRIREFCKKYGIHIPKSDTAFWAGVRKTIVNLNAASKKQKTNSMSWLLSHGFSPKIRLGRE